MDTQYSVLKYKIDLYFYEYKLAVEVDKKGYKDRNSETKRQKEIENELNCKFIRINLDKENF